MSIRSNINQDGIVYSRTMSFKCFHVTGLPRKNLPITWFMLLFLLLASCSGGGINQAQKIEALKDNISDLVDSQNLVTDVIDSGGKKIIVLEDKTEIDTGKLISSFFSEDWLLHITFKDQSNITLPYRGADVTYLVSEIDNGKMTPLSRMISIDAPYAGNISWTVVGRNPGANVVSQIYPLEKGLNSFEVHGLYSSDTTVVDFKYANSAGVLRNEKSVSITVGSPAELDLDYGFQVEVLKSEDSERSIFLLSQHRNGSGLFMLDKYGDIRWFLDIPGKTGIYGLQQLTSKELLWVSGRKIFISDLGGQQTKEVEIPEDYGVIHHDVVPVSDTQFLLTVNSPARNQIEDYVILFDIETNEVIKEWDLNLILPKAQSYMNFRYIDGQLDWFHNNAIYWNPADRSLVLSGQMYGLVKVSWDNELEWIIADNKRLVENWEYQELPVLQSESGSAIAWGQHDIQYDHKAEQYLLFDNGLGRGLQSDPKYSNVIVFTVDEELGTYQTRESVGSEYMEYYSPIISGADYTYHEQERFLLACFGSIAYDLPYDGPAWPDRLKIWKQPAPSYGAAIVEFAPDGSTSMELRISTTIAQGGGDRGLYRVRYSEL